MREKMYRNAYAEHCIRHPKDAVAYSTFRWRCRKRGEKLAIRLGKFEGAEKLGEKIQERRKVTQSIHLAQKEAAEKSERRRKIEIIALGITLFALGIILGILM